MESLYKDGKEWLYRVSQTGFLAGNHGQRQRVMALFSAVRSGLRRIVLCAVVKVDGPDG